MPTSAPNDSTRPTERLADLSKGASWSYITLPGTVGLYPKPALSPTGHKYVVLVPAGLPLTAAAGYAAMDRDIPGALIRLYKTDTIKNSAFGPPPYRYDGTYRQDPVTRDLYLLRLPTGELLDKPARILPGKWEWGTEIRSDFVVSGKVEAEYDLMISAPEVIDTLLGRKPVWLTNTSISWLDPMGKSHTQMSKQEFEPASGNYLQATFRDSTMVLDDLTLVKILDDEKISAYTVNP